MSAAGSAARVTTDGRGTILSWRRVLLGLAGGVVVGGLAVVAGVPELAVLLGWLVAAGGLLTWAWRISWPCDAEGTQRLAEGRVAPEPPTPPC